MTVLIHLIFFLSGASALIFETLWFRQCGLVFGSSVWAASLVLASFMGGLALGNAYAAFYRGPRALRAYGILEGVIGIGGVGLVLLFPKLTVWLVPLFKPFLSQANETVLNFLRFAVAFALLLVPTAAMGATLPLVTRALGRRYANFGDLLGRLYGLNTAGAVLGVLAGEMVLIKHCGVLRTGLCAGSLNLLLCIGVLAIARREIEEKETGKGDGESAGTAFSLPWRLLLAAFLSGMLLLAAEVLWTRFLLLFVYGTSLAFAMLLAAVLCGIALGGFIASQGARREWSFTSSLFFLAIGAGIACVVGYAKFESVASAYRASRSSQFLALLPLVLLVAFPTAVFSGLLFTGLGAALKRRVGGDARPSGLLTLANTLGGMCGALLGGFVLLTHAGVEKGLFFVAVSYGVVALLTATDSGLFPRKYKVLAVTMALAYVVVLVRFPFGRMRERFLLYATYGYKLQGEKEVGYREALTETLLYLKKEFLGEPHYYRLITNSYPMSSSHWFARRYMKLYVYLPVALHPHPETALLISYGVGMTAKALTDTESFRSIDVVDISKDILEMNRLVFPDPRESPLHDPRVHTHIEDGRYFLQTTDRKYDLITAEPPPPKNAGIQNLYSQEYFQLAYDRLNEGGMVSYWLPSVQLPEEESKAIIKGFCNVFPDCTLWAGSKLDLMILGTRGTRGTKEARETVTEEHFSRQWRDPKVGPEMQRLGFETPEQLGALFIADAPVLQSMTETTPPLIDDFPYRISSTPSDIGVTVPLYLSWMDPQKTRERFEKSEFVRAWWPEGLRVRSLDGFKTQGLLTDIMIGHPDPFEKLQKLDQILSETDLKQPVYWLMGSDGDQAAIVDPMSNKAYRPSEIGREALKQRGINSLARRKYAEAEADFEAAQDIPENPRWDDLTYYRIYLLRLTGNETKAKDLEATLLPREKYKSFFSWLEARF